ncbi:TauD/TfdA family dioxygenase [Steroidobacter sp.]|uniref:TauD/TfdA family dioxygenase n=1 Tax=Steroidobacter sp. TaxID=1978227 RepID=UPI001A414FE8|nr:TauD/TfdA family dioxygenase [Steroidobacter sp.]MBL8267036.1 TauD/TfdA family dioxygenase [Steroidobacter sp.]
MSVENLGTRVRISWSDGVTHDFHPFWLRESSVDPQFRDPKTGHKLLDAEDIPLDVKVTEITQRDGTLDLQFSDGHSSSYSLDKLHQAAVHPRTDELIGKKILWDGSFSPSWYEQSELESQPAKLLALLNDIASLGFALVRGIPAELNGMARFIDQLGYMRITNNGGIEDIKALPSAKVYDLSMTPRALEPHCDNPYRVPQPGYTLLHCIRNDAQGGESALIDGLYVADRIRRDRPDLFEALSTVPIVFRYADDQAILEHTCPFLDVTEDGTVTHARFHGRCDQVTATDPAVLSKFYEARRMYSKIIMSDAAQLQFKLQPGEMFMVDNYRLFHARRGFRLDSGIRHMQQAYIDRDVVSSRQKTLLRDINAKPWKSRI